MSVKVVNTTVSDGNDPSAVDLWTTAGTENVTSLYHNTIEWAADTDYSFTLNFTAGRFQIEIFDGDTLLSDISLMDNTYTSGEFGFYNNSQGGVLYSEITIDDEPSQISLLSTAGKNSGTTSGLTSRKTSRRVKEGQRLSAVAERPPQADTIPETATLLLMGIGLAGIGYMRHRSKKAT
jgi:hypothetical protein